VITNLLLGSYFYNFLDFKKKLEQDYGKPLKKIQFKDDEGDFITITSDLELLEARKLGSTEFKIIFDQLSKEESCGELSSPADYFSLNQQVENKSIVPFVHSASCDYCQENIVGIRYKCANCVDYDLCDTCEAENSEGDIHDRDHVFLKIYRPVQNNIPYILPNLYQVHENYSRVQQCPARFHLGAVSCPYIKSLESRLEKVEKELDEVQKNLLNKDQHVNKDKADKERKQAEKRKEIQLRKQIKQQKRRSKKLLKQQQKILNTNPANVPQELFEVKKDEILQKDNISLPPKETESNVQENDSSPKIEDFTDLLSEEEKQPIDHQSQSQSQPETPNPSPYEKQLALLASMGFMDRNLNESLMFQFDNVYRVMDELLD